MKHSGYLVGAQRGDHVLIQADDGRVYKNPILANKAKTFYVSFTNNKSGEFVGLFTAFPDYEHVVEALNSIGISCREDKTRWFRLGFRNFNCLFGRKYSSFKAISYDLNLEGPIPAKYIFNHEGIYEG
jgi:hypothetical protein